MKRFGAEEVDVCVVGSGAGGAPMALGLSRAGAKVVVLEKGPWYQRGDFDHDEIANCRRNKWVPFVADEPHLIRTPESARARRTAEGWIANCVGGGTVHMSGFVYRLHPEDFRLATRYGALPGAELADWPISYDDLAPYYHRVEREIGVSGQAGVNPFEPARSGPYPHPPLQGNPLAGLIDAGAKKLGLHPFSTPRAIISQGQDGRAACAYCDFCGSYGCEMGAKSSALDAILPKAIATDRCEIRPHSMAYEVFLRPDGKVGGVRYYDAEGELREQKARVVCVSATAIESARLLLNSTSARFPNGLANGNGLVGRHLSFSTLGKAFGEVERAALPPALRETHPIHFLQRSLQDFYFLPERKGGYDKGGTLNFILPHRNPIFTAERLAKRATPPLWGPALKQALYRYYRDVHELEFEVFGEFLPNPKTFVSVEGGVQDKWGIPSATIHLDHHPESAKNGRILVKKGLEVLRAAGATKTWVDAAVGTTFVLQHGTCRFGADPTRAVLDVNCRSHEVDNLYVVDGSFMPTSGGVPTTLTILANAFRVADHLVGRFKARAL